MKTAMIITLLINSLINLVLILCLIGLMWVIYFSADLAIDQWRKAINGVRHDNPALEQQRKLPPVNLAPRQERKWWVSDPEEEAAWDPI